jgi:hypothetical protein
MLRVRSFWKAIAEASTLKGHEQGGSQREPRLTGKLAIMEVARAAEDESLGRLGQGAGDNGGDSN